MVLLLNSACVVLCLNSTCNYTSKTQGELLSTLMLLNNKIDACVLASFAGQPG